MWQNKQEFVEKWQLNCDYYTFVGTKNRVNKKTHLTTYVKLEHGFFIPGLNSFPVV